jgi:N-acylmannosamine kinase
MPDYPILTFDIGGTKIGAAIVVGDRCEQRRQMPTPRTERGEDLIEAVFELSQG